MTTDEMMVLLKSNPEVAQRFLELTNIKAKKLYVEQKHTHKIFVLQSEDKYRNGNWATHVIVDGKRKVVYRATEDKLYDFLFNFYQAQDMQHSTFNQVFDMYIEDKRNHGRSELTIKDYQRYINFIPQKIRAKELALITDTELRSWFVKDYLSKAPKKEAMKKMLQHLKAVFEFGMRKQICFANPALDLLAEDYFKYCDLTTRANEDRSFSQDDIEKLRKYALEDKNNPHAAMMLLAMETGLRAGELAALKYQDIEQDIIHVRRQQVIFFDIGSQTKRKWGDVEYTKNERTCPHDGRLVPITENCLKALMVAYELPGDSEYIFHHPDGKPVLKDSYLYYLRRRCKTLKIPISHNHAFRVAFNAKLIAAGIDGNDRCMVLGHSMQTNERHYSFGDKRRVEEIRAKLNKLDSE